MGLAIFPPRRPDAAKLARGQQSSQERGLIVVERIAQLVVELEGRGRTAEENPVRVLDECGIASC